MLKAVIFDMDGVLIDSEPLHARAAVHALKELGIEITIDYAYQFIGNTTLYMLKTIERDFQLDITAEELLLQYKKWERKLSAMEGYPAIPYIKELILDLHSHGMKLAIASSSPLEAIKETADNLGITSYFTKLISGMSVPKSKPHPDIFLKAASELSVSVDECLIIEDSTNGILAGVRANIPVIGFYNPHSGNQDLSKACLVVEGFEEVDYNFMNKTYHQVHNLPFTIAETNRLLIRELSTSDAKELYELYQDPAFLVPDVTPIASSIEETKDKLESYMKYMYHLQGFGLYGVFSKETTELIGHCGIELKEVFVESVQQSIYELSYAIKQSEQQKGYAYESICAILDYIKENLDIPKVSIVIRIDHQISQKVAQKLDFKLISLVTRNIEGNITYQLYEKLL